MIVRRLLLLLAGFFLVSGCTIKFYYNQLDWLIPWYLDDYFTFTSAQREVLDRDLARQLRWHRDTQLPLYARWLRQIHDDLENGGLNPAKLDQYQNQAERYWEALLGQAVPTAAAVLATASDDQIEQFLGKLAEQNQEFRDEYITPSQDDLRRNRVARVRKQLDRWLYELTPAQEQALEEWSRQFEPIERERLAYRERWQASLRELLARRRDPAFQGILGDFVKHPERTQSALYQRQLARNRDLAKNLILRIHGLMTPEQKTAFLSSLDTLAADFQALAKAGERFTGGAAARHIAVNPGL